MWDPQVRSLNSLRPKLRRFYKTPDDKWYPSVTTVTSHISAPTIKAWEERVGWEKAEKIRRTSSLRGSKYHGIVESYLKGDLQRWRKARVFPRTFLGLLVRILIVLITFTVLKLFIVTIYVLLAGLIVLLSLMAKLAIIDFKTTGTLKQEAWLEKYFVQEAAYSYMYWERTGCEVKKLVTLSIAEDGQTQVVEKYDKIPYIDTLCEWIKEFRYFLGSKV